MGSKQFNLTPKRGTHQYSFARTSLKPLATSPEFPELWCNIIVSSWKSEMLSGAEISGIVTVLLAVK